jgi:hypothetical protein
MIRRSTSRDRSKVEPERKSFDDFELRLGDLMRGERATLGKSLLDVQRELKIKATYISAIENSDPTAFDTPGFIAGYVRSYAKYLGMDSEWAFEKFCQESNFSLASGLTGEAVQSASNRNERLSRLGKDRDAFAEPSTPFIPSRESVFGQIEAGAIVSSLVLIALISSIGYGGWAVLQEVQRVQFAPIEQAPTVFADVDPLDVGADPLTDGSVSFAEARSADAFDRLYRPQALDVPVFTPRDGPIAALDPSITGSFVQDIPVQVATAAVSPNVPLLDQSIQVLEEAAPDVVLLAVRPAWVRIEAVDGSIIFEKILDAGEEYTLTQDDGIPLLRAGNSGSLFFKVKGEIFGPAGEGTSVAKNVTLDPETLVQTYAVADLTQNDELARIVALAQPQGDPISE